MPDGVAAGGQGASPDMGQALDPLEHQQSCGGPCCGLPGGEAALAAATAAGHGTHCRTGCALSPRAPGSPHQGQPRQGGDGDVVLITAQPTAHSSPAPTKNILLEVL